MTIKEAILQSLEDLGNISNYMTVYNHIVAKKYYDFGASKTPASTISAQLGEFVRNGDVRVRRIKEAGGTYSYYLTKNEEKLGIDLVYSATELATKSAEKQKTYDERDLHILLSTYLKSTNIYSKTIFHEQSNYGKDTNQIWTHPDMIGIQFLNLQSKASQNLIKAVNQVETFKISSYEIKKEINSDNELKKAFFQAVSNSSWSNYGYLVAFEFSESLSQEMERLNHAFGIGILELSANPYQSKILFQPKYKEIDFKMIDKLCKINKEFEKFVEQIEKIMTAEERYLNATEREFSEFCDKYFLNESEVDNYLKQRHIPIEQ
jgi:uncharacterized protein